MVGTLIERPFFGVTNSTFDNTVQEIEELRRSRIGIELLPQLPKELPRVVLLLVPHRLVIIGKGLRVREDRIPKIHERSIDVSDRSTLRPQRVTSGDRNCCAAAKRLDQTVSRRRDKGQDRVCEPPLASLIRERMRDAHQFIPFREARRCVAHRGSIADAARRCRWRRLGFRSG